MQTILDSLKEMSVADWIFTGIFLFIFLFRLYYLLLFSGRVVFRSRKEVIINQKANQPITVFLTVRNEEDSLRRLLPQLLSVKDVNYDVVVVDDYSLDNTFTVLGSFKQCPNFRFSSLNEETRFSVKLAQNIALKAAQNDWVLSLPIETTEVDKDWLNGFSINTTTDNRNVMMGYSGIKNKPGYYNLLCRTENFLQQLKSLGYVANGIPFVYFEDNVAFRKEEYFKLGGYGQLTKEAYANLELIINQFITKKKTVLLFNEHARITKDVETNRDDFYNLLNRSFRIEKYLPAWKRTFMGFDTFTNVLYSPLLIVMFVLYFKLCPLLTLLAGFKIMLHIILLKITLNRLRERKIFLSSLVYGWLIPYFKPIYKWYFNQSAHRNRWKIKV
ncbi:glycosyltransferase [Maribellus sp. YY47]|uniref:glycosyltransferase n=1 Tax=Maribellus sp. YY47 TaxID=2929486 RepID=UPI002000B71D|nr:glycosyltransferase [Maribellus sp. YY47]MCK3684678.1 glycosyltransferase [Maribellus sp. YY47]